MKRRNTSKNLSSKEIQDALKLLNTYVFVDGSDLGISLPDAENLSYLTDNPERAVRHLTHYCRTFGYVQESYVFDDDWKPITNSVWSNEGYKAISVERETSKDTRVGMVMALRAYQIARRLSTNAVFVFVVGGSNYQEVIEEVMRRGFKVVLIGVEDYLPSRVKEMVDVWVPLHKAVPDVVTKGKGLVEGYNWDDFVSLVNSLENSDLDFVGVKHLIRKVLPTIGLDLSEAHVVIEEAQSQGIIKIYKVPNPRGQYPVRACKLDPHNDVVTSILSRSEPTLA